MANKRILVIGGGYIGSELVKELQAGNFDVTVLLRKDCDLLDKECLRIKIRNFDIVVNLASVVRTVNKQKYAQNLAGLTNLVDVLKENNINKLVYFSTQNVNLNNKGPYAKSKTDCENFLKNCGIGCMIIRPNLVYGIDRKNDFFRLAIMISRFRIAPIIGSGENRIQPVLNNDLAKITVNLISNFTSGSIVEVSGKETVSVNEVVSYLCDKLNTVPLKIHMSISVLKAFKRIIPFDIDGLDESRLSKNPIEGVSNFFNNLDSIVCLLEKK